MTSGGNDSLPRGVWGGEGTFTLRAQAAVHRMLELSSPLGRYYVVLLLRKVKSVINLKLYSKAIATQALVET